VIRRLFTLAFAALAMLFAINVASAGAVGFQWVVVADPDDRPLEVAV
jgi:hypothetical protein